MRAPVQKTRPRRTGKQTAPAGSAERTPGTSTPPQPPEAPVGKGRRTHVRNRLIVAVAVVAAAVAGAGAPSVVAASGQLHDSQELVTLAEQTQGALTLAHSLADERDEVTPYIAAGRPKSKAPSEQRSARVDRQVEELRADPDTPASLREDLDAVAALRRAALTGKSTALQAHEAYSEAITELHALAEKLGEEMPPRAGSGAYALAELDTAVQQAAATRGLLLAALNVPSSTETVIDPVTGLPTETTTSSDADAEQRDALAAAAQQARVRSDAALADFREGAPKEARSSFDATVAGPEVNSAEKYLAGLTDEPTLSDGDLRTSTKRLDAALSARVDAMRGAESALYEKRVQALEQLRDDDVTALEIRIAVLGALILLAVGIATALARTLTRPLSVLRRGSARLAEAEDPTTEEAVAFTGRNDEFAEVVRSVNALHRHAATLAGRVATLESDRKHLVGQRQKMADAREELRAELAESAAQLEVVRKSIGSTFVNLALRTLGLVERQLAVIEGLEEREQDPDRLATLFKLDHFATVMRRHSENLLVLAGTEHVQHSASPVPLVDVVRAAVSEIERYERVRIAALPPHAHVAGFAADDLSHLLAELMENATSFSPPDLPVEVSGWLLENGEVMLSVQDEGIGMATERLQRLNARLTDFDPDAPFDQEGEDGLGLGLYVVARLAHRHGARVRLREQKQGGVAAVVVLPSPLLAAAPPAALAPTVPVSDGTGSFSLPGADAEANSNVLHGRTEQAVRADQDAGTAADPEPEPGTDPLVASAEDAVRRAEEDAVRRGEEDASRADADATGATEAEQPARSGTPDAGAQEPGAQDPAPDGPGTPDDAPAPEPHGRDEEVPGDGAAPGGDLPDDATMALFLPALAEPETPAEPVSDPYAIGPDAHDRTPDEGTGRTGDTDRVEGSEPTEGSEPAEPVTDKGLPKRTPKLTTPAAVPRPRTSGSVDADALRRRLGGFRRGAEAGRRDVEAEIADRTGPQQAPVDADTTEEATGGTVEEASS
ncbi:nitrate- and nitrite sensing domain-containing protein [Streptomyces sp. RK23]|uniref:nitrate- and nitrite sensing domain-containing protein n=1 Tax=Streptomyces TaxID=1883 RepID=UPI001B392C2A|nr:MULTISPECIES: nitrate- and nitrite sensing domain-containing protein [unclassified Streptomyces]MBQ0966538.1 nitrate- and nitrite sensing domain-containing protein [Streptomyces sp. RK74B]MBQ1006643.1 nitrate- and nitrite sensing domain-containing protein [Streptomyces sp. RK23]